MRWSACVAVSLVCLSTHSCLVQAAEFLPEVRSAQTSAHGISTWISDSPFDGDLRFFSSTALKPFPPGNVVAGTALHITLECATAIIGIPPDGSALNVWTRRQNKAVRRGKVKLDADSVPAQFKLIDDQRTGQALEVLSTDQDCRHTIRLSPDGLVQIDQPVGRSITITSRMRYLLAPSMVGTDLLYSPRDLKGLQGAYATSANVLVGLLDDCNGMLVAAWPPGEQVVRFARSSATDEQIVDTLSLDTAGQSFYLAYLERPEIWHEVTLKKEFLEKDTLVDWKRPLEARWIGRFHIESDDYSYPFYFLTKRHRAWGRYIRGWFYYPVWFEGTRTMIHFEKKFPPKGRLLIYYLESLQGGKGVVSPMSVMRAALGDELAAKLLDVAGARQRPLLAHGNAVCAMTREIELYFAKGADAPPQSLAESYSEDVSTFIRLIRERIAEYDNFAGDMLNLLEQQVNNDPSFAGSTEELEELLLEMRDIAREDLPDVALDEVNRWTSSMRKSAGDIGDGDLARIKQLTQKCRSVAGTQDDMARDLSVLAVRLIEQAAAMGTASEKHLRLAEQLIGETRAVLRRPTWWEVCRRYEVKSNPGAGQ